MHSRNAKQDDSLFKPWHLIIAVVVVVAGLFYSYGVMQKAYTVYPDKLFAEYFSNTPDRITDLKGDGNISSMSDIWLTFGSADIIRFRKPQFVTMSNPNRAWHYFSELFPHDKDAQEISDMEAWTYYDHPDPVKLVNGWLLHNKKSNRYWFRVWGRT